MKIEQFEKDKLEKLVNDLDKICDEQDRKWREHKAKQRKYFCAGVFFLVFASACGIMGIVLNKPNVFIGVVAQLFASSTLIINNIDGFRSE